MSGFRAPNAPCEAMARRSVFNVSGPYAVGKDTLLNSVIERFGERVHRVGTVTTRSVSLEKDPTYRSVSMIEMQDLAASGNWLVNYQLSGATGYATSVVEIEDAIQRSTVPVLSIHASKEGAGVLRSHFGRRLYSLALLPPGGDVDQQLQELRQRLLTRDRDDAPARQARLLHQREVLAYVNSNPSVNTPDGKLCVFDDVIVNDDLCSTIDSVLSKFAETFEV